MKRYIKKSILFSIPFIIYFVFIFLIDPYEFINISHIINSDIKLKVIKRSDESLPRGNMLWKTIQYKREPLKNILIGDSQGAEFKVSLINNISGDKYYNFCVDGASYETMFNFFWRAAEITNLERVYFQVGFMNYNSTRSYDLFHLVQDIINKPFSYFTSKDILIDSYYNFMYAITKNDNLINKSYRFSDENELDNRSSKLLNLFFRDYIYPKEYLLELQKIKSYCIENNIEIKFIILPNYMEVHNYLKRNNLLQMESKFKDDIKSIGFTYDFDNMTTINSKRGNFLDYFHPKDYIIDDLTRKIWNQK
ncbi:MAG: hypothetical protein K8R74_06965 [Bacteroidales bacterium]|nr:hypothetical protein [Bacteroidales bacterium]